MSKTGGHPPPHMHIKSHHGSGMMIKYVRESYVDVYVRGPTYTYMLLDTVNTDTLSATF